MGRSWNGKGGLADGERVAKGTITTMSCDPTANGFQTQSDYVRDQAGNQLSEFTPGTGGGLVLVHTNVWANGMLIATDDSTETHYYLNDWLGTRRVQTDYAGNLEQSCASLPYGDGETCGAPPSGNLYTGKERDSESGNDYFGARYYGSVTGRFTSPDFQDDETDPEPVPWADYKNPQSLNLYSYVYNNPLSHADNDGHDVSICPAGATQVTMACQTIGDDQYKAAQQANNGGLNVPSLESVGANGSGNITDSNGNSVGTAIYSSDSGVDYYANQGAFQTLGAAQSVVNVMGGIGLTAASFVMPEVLAIRLSTPV
jgi:RHS repeat-associated protein